MLSSVIMNPSKKKIAACFAIAALGAGVFMLQKNHFDHIWQGITPADITASPDRANYFQHCVASKNTAQITQVLPSLSSRLQAGKMVSPEDAGLTEIFQHDIQAQCENWAQDETKRSVYRNRTTVMDVVKIEATIFGGLLAGAGGLMGCLSLALTKRKPDQKSVTPKNN